MKSGTVFTKSDTCVTSGGTTSSPIPVRTSSAIPKTTLAAQWPTQPSPLERLDGGIERRREDDRHDDPRQHVPGEIEEDEQQADEHRDADHCEDRPRPNGHDAHFWVRHLRVFRAYAGTSWRESGWAASAGSSFDRSCASGTPARIASSCAATATPKRIASAEKKVQS